MSRRKRDQNGFEGWGGYMAAKKAKLEDQFKKTATEQAGAQAKGIFEGVAIFVNGYTGVKMMSMNLEAISKDWPLQILQQMN